MTQGIRWPLPSLLFLVIFQTWPSTAMALGDFSVSAKPDVLAVHQGSAASSHIVIGSGVIVLGCADYQVSVTSSPASLALALNGTHFCVGANQQATSALTINPYPSGAPPNSYTITVTVGLCTSSDCSSFSLTHAVTITVNIVSTHAQVKWWSDWATLSRPSNITVAAESVAQNQDKSLELFAVGGDGNLYHLWQLAPNGNWSSWDNLGSPPNTKVYSPAATSDQDGRLEVFAVGSDGNLWHISQAAPNNAWGRWRNLGNPPNAKIYPPTVGRNQDGRLEIFAVGGDGNLWHISQAAPNGGWGNWGSLSRPLNAAISSPTVGQNQDGRLEVFVVGSVGTLYHMWQAAPNSGWSSWANLNSPLNVMVSSPMVAKNQNGHLEVFAVGSDENIWHISQAPQNDGWTSWSGLSHPPGVRVSSPVAVSNQDGRLEIFGVGSDDNLWHIWQVAPNSGWSDWGSLGSPSIPGILSPAVSRNQDGRLEAFVLTNDSAVWHSAQSPAASVATVSELPPSSVFPPSAPGSGDKWQYLVVRGTQTKTVNGAAVELIELRGWLRELNTGCYHDDPDWHYEFEPDPDWLDQLGLKLTDIIRPGNILNIKTHATPDPQTWRNLLTVPLIHVELNGWRPSDYSGVASPAPDWGFENADPGACPGVSWAFNPVNPLPTQGALVEGQYVRIVGSLLTDEPHARGDPGQGVNTFMCLNFGICGTSSLEHTKVKNELMEGYAATDPNNPMRWTEIHPPDVIAWLDTRAQTNTVRAVLLDAAGETQTADFDIPAPGPAPSPCAGLQCQETIIGAVTDLRTVIKGNRDLTGGAMTNFSDHFHIYVATQASNGGLGKFGAIYRVYWQNLRCMSAVAAIVQKSRTRTAIRVTVKDSLSSQPIPRATVKVFDDLSDDVRASGITAADGSVTLTYSTICIDPETKKPIACSLVVLATIAGYGDRSLKAP
jgi:hypothetical protein